MSQSDVYIDLPIDGITTQIAVIDLIVNLPSNIFEGAIRYVDENKSIYTYNGTAWIQLTSGGSGSVSSVALAVPVEFNISGSPITTSGTFTVSKADQNANLVYAGPSTGVPTAPTFRPLVVADIPGLSRNLTVTWIPADGTTKTITHNWGIQNILIETLEIDAGYTTIVPDVVSRPTINTAILTVSAAPTGSGFLVLLTEVLN